MSTSEPRLRPKLGRGLGLQRLPAWLTISTSLSHSSRAQARALSPSRALYIMTSTPRSISGMQSITPMFAWGVLLAVCGSAIRTWCYSILGRLFTYEVALRPGHTLIRRPPYTIVRHPSYTGFFLHFIGIAIVYFSPGGWIRECSVMRTSVGSFVIVWLVLVAYVFVCMWKRGALEDQLLQDAFGPEWDQYAHDVPWKFCPWIV